MECFASAWGCCLDFCSDKRQEEGLEPEKLQPSSLPALLTLPSILASGTSRDGRGEWGEEAPASARALRAREQSGIAYMHIKGTEVLAIPGKHPGLLVPECYLKQSVGPSVFCPIPCWLLPPTSPHIAFCWRTWFPPLQRDHPKPSLC